MTQLYIPEHNMYSFLRQVAAEQPEALRARVGARAAHYFFGHLALARVLDHVLVLWPKIAKVEQHAHNRVLNGYRQNRPVRQCIVAKFFKNVFWRQNPGCGEEKVLLEMAYNARRRRGHVWRPPVVPKAKVETWSKLFPAPAQHRALTVGSEGLCTCVTVEAPIPSPSISEKIPPALSWDRNAPECIELHFCVIDDCTAQLAWTGSISPPDAVGLALARIGGNRRIFVETFAELFWQNSRNSAAWVNEKLAVAVAGRVLSPRASMTPRMPLPKELECQCAHLGNGWRMWYSGKGAKSALATLLSRGALGPVYGRVYLEKTCPIEKV